MPTPAKRWRPERRMRYRALIWVMALVSAIGVVAAIVVNARLQSGAANCPRVIDHTADATVDGQEPPVTRIAVGAHIAAGASGTIRLQWDDGTTVDLGSQAEAVMVGGDRQHLTLSHGDFGVLITPQAAGRPFTLDLPQVRVECLAGRFTSIVTNEISVQAIEGRLHLIPVGSAPRDVDAPAIERFAAPAPAAHSSH